MYKINNIVPDKHNFFQMTWGIAKFPKKLYSIGTLPESHPPTIAIIGTRKPSRYGEEVGYRLAYDLAKQGVVVVSGLALGMDAIAHRGALDAGGVTIAVMPGGLDSVYPKSHTALAKRIITSGGALISEYTPGTDIYARNFIDRNRIVAAISDGVLVVEAAIKSGTVHTAGFALDHGRPVMAVPGNITNPMSSGTNILITTGARLITSADDVLDEIGVRTPHRQAKLPMGDNAQETVILQLIGRGIQDGEELQKQSELSPAVFSQTLTMLEITQKIRPLGGNKWGL
jgi:DNA processing protein